MRHVVAGSPRAAFVACALAVVLSGCVPQPPEASTVTADGATAGATSSGAARPSTPALTPSRTSATASPSTADAVAAPVAPAVPRAPADDAPGPVLAALPGQAPPPTEAGLRARLDPFLRAAGLGGRVSVDVADVASGGTLLSRNATDPVVPASTTKLLTAVAALSVLGAQDRLPTTVVADRTGTTLTLVAGGDMLLTSGHGDPDAVVGHAGLADLADDTAAALKAAGRRTVALRLDDAVFPGARTDPGWRTGDLTSGFVAPVGALAVENGRAVEGRPSRVSDPALLAARSFAALLTGRGVTVRGDVTRADTPDGADGAGTVAEIRGATVADVVEHMLVESDNTVADSLARLVAARSGYPATFEGAGEAVVAAVGELGVPTDGARFSGGSGLARGGLIAPRTLTAALVTAASPDHPELRATLSGLPVAGVTGTLADRYTTSGQRAAVGVVRAKTGTLTGASSLAGTVVDADGRLLAFAVVADRVGRTADARAALDSVATALAGCGCR